MDEESEKQLTTYEKWAVIRHAAEQVLQVYANRSNARNIESEDWTAPNVLNVKSGAASGARQRPWRFCSSRQNACLERLAVPSACPLMVVVMVMAAQCTPTRWTAP